jgi:hypothetical protein
MRKFSIFIIVSLLILVVLDRGTGYLFDSLYRQTKTGQTGGKINYYFLLPKTPDWVVMGNSRALYQIIPDSFALPTYNLCHAGMHQVFQTGLLTQMEREGKMPKLILLHLEPEEFIGEQFNSDIQNLKFYHGKNDWITRELNSLSRYEQYKFFFATYRYNGRVISQLKNYLQTIRSDYSSNGYVAIKPSETDSITTIYSLNKALLLTNEKLNQHQWNYLNEFLEICNRHGTKVICFTSPIYSYQQKKTQGIRELESRLKNRGIAYVNYIGKSIPSLQGKPSLWKDRHHLNHLGASIESDVMAQDVDSVLRQHH